MHGLSSGMAEDDESDDCRVNKSPSIFFLLQKCIKYCIIFVAKDGCTIYMVFKEGAKASSFFLALFPNMLYNTNTFKV